jgi:hypothetical protein
LLEKTDTIAIKIMKNKVKFLLGSILSTVALMTVQSSDASSTSNNLKNVNISSNLVAQQAEMPSRRPRRALKQKCVKASGSNLRGIGRDDSAAMVSVGQRAIKVFALVDIYTGSPYGETCAIEVHSSSEKVALAFAIPDNSSLYEVRVSVYVDGEERTSEIMSRGQDRRYTVDITGANSYAFTLQPLDRIDGHIYFPYISQPR